MTTRPDLTKLEERLEKGWQMIEAQKSEAIKVQLENHFFKLLREYEQRYDTAMAYIESEGRR